jgi:hypothetical protein
MRSGSDVSQHQSNESEREGGEELFHNRLALLHIHPTYHAAHCNERRGG